MRLTRREQRPGHLRCSSAERTATPIAASARRVSVHAQRGGPDIYPRSVCRKGTAQRRYRHRLFRGLLGVGEKVTLFASWDEGPVGPVAAVAKGLRDQPSADPRISEQRRSRGNDERGAVEVRHDVLDGSCAGFVRGHLVVERSVRLYVPQAQRVGLCYRLDGAHLCEQVPRRSAGSTRSTIRPNPFRSRYEGCAPTATPWLAA